MWAEQRKQGTGVSVKLDGEATSACGLSRASPQGTRRLLGIVVKRHEASFGDSILRRVYGFEAQKS